ncbi:MAG: sulfatase-like hydrolase/transferase, partial [Planctomycetota bacterium]
MIASLCITWLGALATGPGAHGAVPEDRAASNVLLIVLDDVGADAISCYPGAAADARTPVIDRLAAEGVRFDRVWANPACSPTRATILTGRYGFRTGVGSVKVREEGGLAPEEVTLAESLRAADPSVRTAFLGKWHLGPGEEQGPVPQGFERFRGTTGNLGGREGAYFEYPERAGRDLATVTRRRYATSAVVDDALAVVEEFGPAPWLVVASFHAAHNPLHAPPAELHGRDLSQGPAPSDRARFMAMVDALDREIGRLVDGLDPEVRRRTHVIVLSDNGGASRTRLPGHPGRQGKGSLFEDGVRVPMVVAGPAVARPGRASDALVNTTDLFATIHELLGARPATAAQDSVSFAPALRGASAGGRR